MNAVISRIPTRANSMSVAHRVVASSSWRRCGGDHRVDVGPDVVHRALADAGVQERLRRVGAVVPVERDRGLEFGELLAHEVVDAAGTRALLGRALRHQQFPELAERAVDLRHRGVVGGEVLLLAGQQVPALAGLGIHDQRQRLLQRRLHFERDRHLLVRVLEATVSQLGIHGDRERRDDAEHQRGNDLEG